MAVKGRIQEAIEQAKQATVRNVTDRKTASSAAVLRGANLPMPEFKRVAYNPDQCLENRVLLPAIAELAQSRSGAAYRVLRTRLLHRARSNNWTAIGVTSPGQGDGKSLTALNLALSIARQADYDVFLVDFDMRRPKMCSYLGADAPLEINDFLAGTGSPADALFSVGIDNLTLAGTTTSSVHASELLASQRVEELLEYIRNTAPRPLIIVDLPPLLSTDDALVVALKIDACLLVLAEGKTRRDGALKSLELLSEFELAGIVLNRSRAAQDSYYSS